jgi:hypothetical protein
MKTKFFISIIFTFFFSFVNAQIPSDSLKVNTVKDSLNVEKIYTLTDGTKVTDSELKAIFDRAWEKSFGSMTKEEEELLFSNVKVEVTTEK